MDFESLLITDKDNDSVLFNHFGEGFRVVIKGKPVIISKAKSLLLLEWLAHGLARKEQEKPDAK